jgi:hypothetical protein
MKLAVRVDTVLRDRRIPILLEPEVGKVVYDDRHGRARTVIGPVDRIAARLKEHGYITGRIQ